MDDVIKELRFIASIKNPLSETEDFLLMGKSYKPVYLDKMHFHEIHAIHAIHASKNKSRILFVDGGDSIIFDGSSFCLGIIRVAGIIYENNKRISRHSKEFYVLIKEQQNNFIIKTFPQNSLDGLSIDASDDSLMIGKEKCAISRILSIIRRFAELDYASYLDSVDIDYVLIDGTLESRYPYESGYISKLLISGKLCALSKTCSLTTKNDLSITKRLLDMSQEIRMPWYYTPVIINGNPGHHAEIYFIKLNADSDYVFRFEICSGFRKDIQELFSLLALNSTDPIFLGYPYGFIDVDQNARITDEESRTLRTKFAAKLGSDWNELSRSLNSTNAHEILDKIRF